MLTRFNHEMRRTNFINNFISSFSLVGMQNFRRFSQNAFSGDSKKNFLNQAKKSKIFQYHERRYSNHI